MINRLYPLFMAVLLMASGVADAACPLIYTYDGYKTQGASIDAACTAVVAAAGAVYSGARTPSQAGQCLGIYADGTGARPYSTVTSKEYCAPPPPDCDGGVSVGKLDVTTGWANGPGVGSAIVKKIVPDGGLNAVSYCQGQCKISSDLPNAASLSGVSCKISQVAVGGLNRLHCDGVPFVKTGTQCTVGTGTNTSGDGNVFPPPTVPDPPTPAGDGSGKCPSGSVPSGQDSSGMTICMGKPTVETAPGKTATTTSAPVGSTDASGNAVSTVTTSTKNSDGSTTTTITSTTTLPGGGKSVTSESTTSQKPVASNGTGGGQGTADKPEDKTDMCVKHPELNVCKNSQVMGECALITCDGDAIQCATLRAAATMECKGRAEKKELEELGATKTGQAMMDGSDPNDATLNQIINAPKEIDLGAVTLDKNGFAPRACLSPKSFSVMGQTVVVDFAMACEKIQPLRYAIIACCSIIAYLIVSKSVLGS